MFVWSLGFITLALLAGAMAYGGPALIAAWIAKMLFMAFFFIAIGLFFFGRAPLRV